MTWQEKSGEELRRAEFEDDLCRLEKLRRAEKGKSFRCAEKR